MSGICGFVHAGRPLLGEGDLRRMAAPLARRGTGDVEHMLDGPVGIAAQVHRLETPEGPGAAPAYRRTGLWVALDGEIYNAPDVWRELVPFGHAETKHVADLVAAAYAQWGPNCVGRFNGVFALAVWDRREGTLTLARDPQGMKSLFWGEQGGIFLFGSELKAIRACPSFAPAVEPAALAEFVTFLYVPPPWTCYRGVRQVRMGQRVCWNKGDVTEAPYHVALPAEPEAVPPPPTRPGEEGPLVRLLEARLCDAIARRLDPAGPTGLFFSGGIDSSVLAGLAGRLAPGRVLAFTVGSAEPSLDEAGAAGRLAAHLRVPHEVLRFSMDECLAGLHRLIETFDEPFGDPAALPTLLACERLRARCRVVLDGSGADGLFGVMPSPQIARVLRVTGGWPAWARRWVSGGAARLPGRAWRDRAALLDYDDPAEPLISWGAWKGRWHRRLTKRAYDFTATEFYRTAARYWPQGLFPAHSALYSKVWGTNAVLRRIERPALRNGLLARLPYEDLHVAQFIRGLAEPLRYRNGTHKVALRRLLATLAPRELWDRGKTGFAFPLASLLAAEGGRLVRHFLAPERLRRHALWDAAVVREAVEAFLSGKVEFRDKVWALLLVELWFDANPDLRGADRP